MNLIDTHAHLDDERFQSDFPQVLERAQVANVVGILTVATTLASSRTEIALAERWPLLRASVGIHPNHAAEAQPDDWDQIIPLTQSPCVVALGETGLDRHWDFTPFPLQEDYFARHLELSASTGLPVIIHCREAEADVLRVLRDFYQKHGRLRGVMHSFSADWSMAEACLAMGLYISFAGMLTYKNADALRTVAARVPSDRLLVETDCPYLTPVPLRGKEKRNEPTHVVHTARCLAETQGLPFEELAALTTANARQLFGRIG